LATAEKERKERIHFEVLDKLRVDEESMQKYGIIKDEILKYLQAKIEEEKKNEPKEKKVEAEKLAKPKMELTTSQKKSYRSIKIKKFAIKETTVIRNSL